MSALDERLRTLAEVLRARGRARVPLAEARALFLEAGLFDRGEGADVRLALRGALDALAALGEVRLPKGRGPAHWDEERAPPLPLVVHVLRAREDTIGPEAVRGPPLHPLLARARDRAGAVRMPSGTDRVNAWLSGPGADAPPAAREERSYEIFGDEKRLHAFLSTGFAAAGGLTLETFRAERVTEPLALTEVSPESVFAIALENAATYGSTARAALACLASGSSPASLPCAVIFGGGERFVASCEGLPDRLPNVKRLYYFGDLDETGLEIALAVRARLASIAVEPWTGAYERLCGEPPQTASEGARRLSLARAEALAAFLPVGLQARASTILAAGARVPQEACGRSALAALLLSDSARRRSPSSIETLGS